MLFTEFLFYTYSSVVTVCRKVSADRRPVRLEIASWRSDPTIGLDLAGMTVQCIRSRRQPLLLLVANQTFEKELK